MKNRIFAICMIVVLLVSFTAFSVSADEVTYLRDEANLLSAEEQQALSAQLADVSQRRQFTVAIVTMDTLPEGVEPKEKADALYDELYGEEQDGCLLLRTLNPRYVYVTTNGSGTQIIDPYLDEIFDEMEEDLQNDRHFAAFETFASLCDVVFTIDGSGEVQGKSEEYLFDTAGLLTEEEQIMLSEKLAEIRGRQQFVVAVVTMESLPEGYTEQGFADALYDELYGEEQDGCLLLRTLDPRYVYISTCGIGIEAIDPKLDNIFDAMEDDFGSDRYYDAFVKYAELAEKYAANVGKFPFAQNLLICLAIGLVIALIVVLILRAQLKSVKPQNLAHEYMKQGSLNVTVARDLYLYSHVTKTKIEQSSSSGGSSGGSSHGGGGRSM